MVQLRKENGQPERYSADNVAAHPSLRKDGVDVDNYLSSKPVYTREYLESVYSAHRDPATLYEGVAWAWHLVARTVIALATFSWLSGPHPPVRALGLRMLAFAAKGAVGAASGATTSHIFSVLRNTSDNGWSQLATRLAENTRIHGGIIALALRPPFPVRLAALAFQAAVFMPFLAVNVFFPSVAIAYDAYRAEEQMFNADLALRMLDSGSAPPHSWLAKRSVPGLAASYYGLPSTATMRDVLLRIRADEACNRHVCFVLAGLRPGSINPFIVPARSE